MMRPFETAFGLLRGAREGAVSVRSQRPSEASRTARLSFGALLALSLVSCRHPEPAGELEIADADATPSASARLDRAEDSRTYSTELAALADDGDTGLRARLALALGRIGDPRAAPALVRMLADREAEVRSAAAFALGLLGAGAGREGIDALISSLDDPEGGVRDAALDALGRAAGAGDLPRLASLLGGKDPARRAAAARALGLCGQRGEAFDAATADALSAALSDAQEPVRFMAAFALFRGGFAASPARATAALRRGLEGDDSFEVRALAIRALAKGNALDDGALDRAMRDPDDRVVATAMAAVAALEEARRCPAAVRALGRAAERIPGEAGCLSGPCAHVVRAALESAASCAGRPEVAAAAARVEASIAQAEEPQPSAGAARAKCLARLVAGRDDLALVACDPRRPWVGKRLLVQRLGAPGEKGAPEIGTLAAFSSDPDLRVAAPALEALAAIPAEAARRAVLSALGDARLSVVGAALDAIAAAKDRFRDPEAIAAIAPVVDRFLGGDVGHAPLLSAAFALGEIGGDRALPLLLRLAADGRPEVRNAAREATAKIPGAVFPATLPPAAPPRPTSHAPRPAAGPGSLTAIVTTTRGPFTIALRPDLAPATVESFAGLARAGFFDGTEIHRVVPNFVVQAGDPTGSGLGDPGYALRCEVTPTPYVRGTVGMALSGKDTGGSQFFVALSRQPHLDARYTVFGEVVSGVDALDVIEEGDSILGVEVAGGD